MSLERNIAGIQATETGYIYSGRVVNSVTGEAIPFATVRIVAVGGGLDLTRSVDANGYFSIQTTIQANEIVITAAEFIGWSFPASQYQNVFELEPKDNTLPEVIVTSGNKGFPWWVLLAAVPFVMKKKKSVGKTTTGNVLTVGTALLVMKGFGLLNNTLEFLGLQESQDTKDLNNASENPLSPWSPNFWKAGPAGTYLLTVSVMENMLTNLIIAFGPFNDDEAAAVAVFKSLKTQSQLSFFSDWFKQRDGRDLLTWLRGGTWPGDRLSDAETNTINAFILKLPKYIA